MSIEDATVIEIVIEFWKEKKTFFIGLNLLFTSICMNFHKFYSLPEILQHFSCMRKSVSHSSFYYVDFCIIKWVRIWDECKKPPIHQRKCTRRCLVPETWIQWQKGSVNKQRHHTWYFYDSFHLLNNSPWIHRKEIFLLCLIYLSFMYFFLLLVFSRSVFHAQVPFLPFFLLCRAALTILCKVKTWKRLR